MAQPSQGTKSLVTDQDSCFMSITQGYPFFSVHRTHFQFNHSFDSDPHRGEVLGNTLKAFLCLLLSQIYVSIHFGVYISFKNHLLKTDRALL